MDVSLWVGPVTNAQVPSCFVPGSAFIPTFNCHNPYVLPVPTCGMLRDSFQDIHGRYLPRMLASRGINIADVQNIYVGSFSAGHSVLKDGILKNEADRKLIKALMLSDSTYSGGSPGKPIVPKGYLQYALDCLTGEKLFCATASASRPPDLPSSREVMTGLMREVETVAGIRFEPVEVPLIHPQPKQAWGYKSIYFFDFDAVVDHEQHALKLAPQMWRDVLFPWLGISCVGPSTTSGSEPAICQEFRSAVETVASIMGRRPPRVRCVPGTNNIVAASNYNVISVDPRWLDQHLQSMRIEDRSAALLGIAAHEFTHIMFNHGAMHRNHVEDERRADEYAGHILRSMGFSTSAFKDFLTRIDRGSKRHPPIDERLAAVGTPPIQCPYIPPQPFPPELVSNPSSPGFTEDRPTKTTTDYSGIVAGSIVALALGTAAWTLLSGGATRV